MSIEHKNKIFSTAKGTVCLSGAARPAAPDKHTVFRALLSEPGLSGGYMSTGKRSAESANGAAE